MCFNILLFRYPIVFPSKPNHSQQTMPSCRHIIYYYNAHDLDVAYLIQERFAGIPQHLSAVLHDAGVPRSHEKLMR
jgi:hypothetical protein